MLRHNAPVLNLFHKVKKFNFLWAVLLTSTALGVSACEQRADTMPVRSSGQANIGGPFTLVDHTGKTVTDADFLGQPQLIYFGFAYCPDVCPTALQQIGAALDRVGEGTGQIQPIFITVDPERDTPEFLAQYVTANGFPVGLVGLTGTPEQLKQVQKAYGVYAKKVEDPSSAAGYTYDHSNIIYFMDKDGKFVDVFTHADTPDVIAKRLTQFLRTGE